MVSLLNEDWFWERFGWGGFCDIIGFEWMVEVDERGNVCGGDLGGGLVEERIEVLLGWELVVNGGYGFVDGVGERWVVEVCVDGKEKVRDILW